MNDPPDSRELTPAERHLATWMLEHGTDPDRSFRSQLEHVRVSPVRCPCGCASIDFIQDGPVDPMSGMRVLGDYVFGTEDDLNGIFIFERGGVLSGMEVYGLSGDAARTLPLPGECRPFRAQS